MFRRMGGLPIRTNVEMDGYCLVFEACLAGKFRHQGCRCVLVGLGEAVVCVQEEGCFLAQVWDQTERSWW